MSKTNVYVDWDLNQVTVTEVPATPPKPVNGVIEVKISGKHFVEGIRMKITALFKQVFALAIIAARDAFGNPLDVNALGSVAWATSDPSIANIVINQDGTVSLVPTGKAGVVQVTATGDTDPNTPEGFIGIAEFNYLPGEVVAIELAATPGMAQPVVEEPVAPVEEPVAPVEEPPVDAEPAAA